MPSAVIQDNMLTVTSAIVDTEPLLKGSLPTSHCLRPGLHEFLEKYAPASGPHFAYADDVFFPGCTHSTISPYGVRLV